MWSVIDKYIIKLEHFLHYFPVPEDSIWPIRNGTAKEFELLGSQSHFSLDIYFKFMTGKLQPPVCKILPLLLHVYELY